MNGHVPRGYHACSVALQGIQLDDRVLFISKNWLQLYLLARDPVQNRPFIMQKALCKLDFDRILHRYRSLSSCLYFLSLYFLSRVSINQCLCVKKVPCHSSPCVLL